MSNLAISIDANKRTVRLLHIKNKLPIYKEIDFSHSCIKNDEVDYDKIVKQIIAPYVFEKENKISYITFVMDDKYVSCDFIEIPTFLRRKKQQTINIEIAKRYNEIDNSTYRIREIYFDKTKMSFSIFFASNLIVSRIYSALNHLKIPCKITFRSACIASSLKTFCDSQSAPTLFAFLYDNEINLILSNGNIIAFSKQVTTNNDNLAPILKQTCADLATYFGFEHIKLKVVCNKVTDYTDSILHCGSDIIELSRLSIDNIDLHGALKPKKHLKGLLF
ncbi:MAG: hypothetical protein IKC35_02240 [Clostridia bacterium]|nr:hypothetical protein [Clostridia bacterium]